MLNDVEVAFHCVAECAGLGYNFTEWLFIQKFSIPKLAGNRSCVQLVHSIPNVR